MHWWQFRKRNSDLDREFQSDLDLEEEEQRDRGLSPEESRYGARRAFGNATLIRERTHEAWGWAPFERVAQDLRYALRQVVRSPGFTITALLILALGIGAVTAVFSLLDAAMLRMLPVKDPQQLVQLKSISPQLPDANDAFSYPAFQEFSRQTKALSGVLAYRHQHNIDVESGGQSGLAEGQAVSGSYFSMLGVRAIRGRTILPYDEAAAGQNPIAVIGYDYWRSRFALDPDIVGKTILLNNSPYTIIGVTEPEFYGLEPGTRIDVSVPLNTYSLINLGYAATGTPFDVLKSPVRNWLEVFARLQPGVANEQAASALEPLFTQIKLELNAALAATPGDSPARRQMILALRLQVDPAGQGLATLRRQFSKPLWIVMALVALLLLITCANVANLLLARAQTRAREISVRLAMGAGKGRLVRQLFIESLLLGLLGGALGVGLAFWGSSLLLALVARGRSPVILSVHPNFAVLAFAVAVSLLTAAVFGILPALRATDVDPSRALAQSARPASMQRPHRLGKALVVFQVAISLVLVAGAGLLARTLVNLRDFYPGFDRENVLLFHVDPTIIGINDVVPVYEQLLSRIRALPGVRLASLSVHEPLSTNISDTSVKVRDAAPSRADDQTPVNVEPIAPDYFAAMRTPIFAGREFTAADRPGAPKVALVNQSMARHFFGQESPIGRFVSIPGYRADTSWLLIVGEVRDIKVHDLRESSTLMLYVPMWQAPEGGATFEVRTAVDPANAVTAVLGAVKAVDSRLPVYSIKTLDDQLEDSLVQERLVASLSGLFGLLALLLTCVGLYGLMACTVQQRTVEIGIRMALGAKRFRIAAMVLGDTLLLVLSGIAIGLPAAMLASRLVARQLFGVKPGDPFTFFAACAVMAVVAVAAAWLPAHRAASVEPMQALRTE